MDSFLCFYIRRKKKVESRKKNYAPDGMSRFKLAIIDIIAGSYLLRSYGQFSLFLYKAQEKGWKPQKKNYAPDGMSKFKLAIIDIIAGSYLSIITLYPRGGFQPHF